MHYEAHPVVALDGVVLLIVGIAAIWWKLKEPTPRPYLRGLAAYAAVVTVLFAVACALDPGNAIASLAIASLSGVALAGCLIAEVWMTPLPTAAATVAELPRARIVSSVAASRGRARIARAIPRGRA